MRRAVQMGVLAGLLGACCVLQSQQPAKTAAALPDAPGMTGAADAAVPGADDAAGTAAISGTVLDTNGSEVQGAGVTLRNASGKQVATARSGGNGEFTFKNLPAGDFKVTVTGPGQGWGTYVSAPIHLQAGAFQFMSGVVLPVTTTASVQVYGNPAVLSQQQVQIAVQQRVFGVFPNFYSTYDPHAPPMLGKQKFQLALRSAIDPVEFASAAAVAGAEQYENVFPSFGTGVTGYMKRYAGAYAGSVSSRMIANGLLPSVFHQDPRYFYRGTGSGMSRAFYAVKSVFVARGDNGRWGPNYSRILGSFASGALSNLYYPASDRGLTLTLSNGAVNLASDGGANLLREFVLKQFTSRGHPKPVGKP
jgi:Carboxypeptidase regulatory-like domain